MTGNQLVKIERLQTKIISEKYYLMNFYLEYAYAQNYLSFFLRKLEFIVVKKVRSHSVIRASFITTWFDVMQNKDLLGVVDQVGNIIYLN